jgi:hypothetical protein
MHRKLFIGIIAVVVLISPAAALADGDIYVGGPYGTKITSLPYTISAPGFYYLGGDLSYAGDSDGDGITINADNVTLDLMGFTLAYTGTGGINRGIYMNGRKNVEVRNGTLLGWDGGVYEAAWNVPVGHRIINIRAVDFNGAVILHGNGHLIQGCTASSSRPGASGFWINLGSGIISGCLVKNFAANGILGHANTIISGNVVIGNGASGSVGIESYGGLVMGNQVSNCGNIGIEVLFPASLIGNTVSTSSSSQTDIAVTMPDTLTLMDQNTVTGPGTHYNWGASPVQWRNNAGYP